MVIEEFSFGNFLSFKDINTLNMTAAAINSKDEELDNNNLIENGADAPLLKTKLIYGANASGKSNLIQAILAFTNIIKDCLSEPDSLGIISSYSLSPGTEGEPTYFQIIFKGDGIRYRYGFVANDDSIFSEWLYMTPKTRETLIFLREKNNIIEINKSRFQQGSEISNLKSNLFNEKTLFLSVASSFNDNLAKQIVEYFNLLYFSGIISTDEKDNFHKKILYPLLKDKHTKQKVLNLLKFADVGISDLKVMNLILSQTKSEYILLSFHDIYDNLGNIVGTKEFLFSENESSGTEYLLTLSLPIIMALELGIPIFIDEFCSTLHPHVAKQIVKAFNSKNSNAQLIAVTHNTELMSSDLLRRDQIDFVEKDQYGASHLYTLVELNGVRKDAKFEKDYLQGKYGAIPYVGNWSELSKLLEESK